ncbi:unnamed protein product [Adineta ricciae]|uniref:Uncharacterized protein n=1 Tax=Adineta ricciae TaxID=249248 RepID=A0A815XSH2_ADIRI|nr:unnamed protein product [Adineta ricciae]
MENDQISYITLRQPVTSSEDESHSNKKLTNPGKKSTPLILITCITIICVSIIIIVLPLKLLKKDEKSLYQGNNSITFTPSTPSNSSDNITYYISELNSRSKIFSRKTSLRKHYYEALKFNVSITGNYTFSSISTIDTYGYLFINEFDPLIFCKNLIAENDDAMKDVIPFEIQSILQSSIIYILVVTTFRSNITGKFSISIQGPEKVKFVQLDEIKVSSVLMPLLQPNDVINAIYNTRMGGNSTLARPGDGSGTYPPREGPNNTCDNNTLTKYLSFGTSKGASIVKGLQICAANGNVARDPLRVTLEGSNETGVNLTFGRSWTSIYIGGVGFDYGPPRYSCSVIQCIANSISYRSYRFLVTEKRRPENSVQYSEIQLFEY